MDNENQSRNVPTFGLETQKKRKWRKRGKQTRKSEDVENGSTDSNVYEADVQENADFEENRVLSIDEYTPEDSPHMSNMNEDSECLQITTDARGVPSSVNIETPQRQISEANNEQSNNNNNPPDFENLKRLNLISDNNINFFCDGLSVSCIRTSASTPNIESVFPTSSNDIGETLSRSNSAATEPEYEKLYNSNALPRDAPDYQLEKFVKNVLIIFNQREFFNEIRKGTEKDVEALTKTFGALNFDVLPYTDRNITQIKQILQAITNQDFSGYGCVAVAVLTHGDINGEIWAKDESYSEMEIINCLKTHKNHSLITKPRLLMIQACRGPNALAGVPVLRKGKTRTDLHYDTKPYTLPVEADMLVVHSSYAGNRAHRDELHGTWFIQTLCKKINEMAATHDLESILTRVKYEVAVDREHKVYNRITDDIDVNKQMPVVTSTLIRKLYFRKYGDDVDYAASVVNEMCANLTVDTVDARTSTEPCLCALDYFDYIKSFLMDYVKDYEEDTTARSLLVLADTLKTDDVFNAAKVKCAATIAAHLQQRVGHLACYKFLHIHKRL